MSTVSPRSSRPATSGNRVSAGPARPSTTTPGTPAPAAPAPAAELDLEDPVVQAFTILRIGFTVAPILFGLDKFLNWMVHWDVYLADGIADMVPGTTHQAMMAVGLVEIVAGVTVWLRPKVGGYLVVAWLTAIIVNLLIQANFYDIALRDFGLLLGALALARLATALEPAHR